MKGAAALILALNETRKTLLASRLHVAESAERDSALPRPDILPGDGVWIRACNRIDTSTLPAPLDLLFLGADHRVVAAVADLGRGSRCPVVEEAVGVLELAAGTIRRTQTRRGDRVLLEPVVADASRARALRRVFHT